MGGFRKFAARCPIACREAADFFSGDYVRLTSDGNMGIVLACLEEASEVFCLLRLLRKLGQVSPRVARWEEIGDHIVIQPSCLEQCTAWYWHADGGLAVLEK